MSSLADAPGLWNTLKPSGWKQFNLPNHDCSTCTCGESPIHGILASGELPTNTTHPVSFTTMQRNTGGGSWMHRIQQIFNNLLFQSPRDLSIPPPEFHFSRKGFMITASLVNKYWTCLCKSLSVVTVVESHVGGLHDWNRIVKLKKHKGQTSSSPYRL